MDMFSERTIRPRVLLALVIGLIFCSHAYSQESVGWIEVISTPSSNGAEIYVDGQFVANVPAKLKVVVGTHKLSIQRKHYQSFERTLDIKDNETITLSALLTSNAKYMKLTTADKAEIWMDGEYLGKGTYSGIISFGKHVFESRIVGNRPGVKEIEISASTQETVAIDAPTPIMGTIKVTASVPATVRIDGKEVGQTPLFLENGVLAGEHNVEINAPNHFVEKHTIVEE